jgi:hypothetical protein
MLDLWVADAHWLERLRKCWHEKCRRPYFIDVGSSARGVYCSDSHRADANKRMKNGTRRTKASARVGSLPAPTL